MHQKISILGMVCMLLSLCGCGDAETPVDYSADVVKSITEGLQSSEAALMTMPDSAVEKAFYDLTDTQLEQYEDYVQACLVTCTPTESGYEVNISCPTKDDVYSFVRQDLTGFQADLKKFASIGASEDDVTDYVLQYESLLYTNDLLSTTERTYEVSTNDGKVLQGDDVFTSVLDTFSEIDVYGDVVESGSLGDDLEAGTWDNESVRAVASTSAFVVSQGSSNFLISDVEILHDAEAVSAVQSLSSSNRKFAKREQCAIYVSYNVTNLSAEDTVYKDLFMLLADSKTPIGYSLPLGLSDSVKVASGQTATVTAYREGFLGASLYYKDDATGFIIQISEY